MAKKWICTVCGYVHEGETAPEKCPQCGVPASKFKELDESAGLAFVTEHELGVAKGCDEEMIKTLMLTLWANAPKSACIWLCRAKPTVKAILK